MFYVAAICVAFSAFWTALLNRFAYAIDIRLSRRLNRLITVNLSRRIFALTGAYANFHFRGEYDRVDELPEQYMIVSNHQSLMDIPLFMRFLGSSRLRFVAKAELGRNVPLVSLILRGDRHCLIKRTGNPSQIMRTMDVFAERVRQNNWIPVIFPEGTRSKDGSVGVFHPAGFRRLLDKAPMPVAVCAVEGGWRVGTLKGIAENMRGGLYRVKILKVYPAPTTKSEQMHILEEGRALIEEQLSRWRCDQ